MPLPVKLAQPTAFKPSISFEASQCKNLFASAVFLALGLSAKLKAPALETVASPLIPA